MFLGETVSSASIDEALEKEAAMKRREQMNSGLTSNVESSSTEGESNASEDVRTKEGENLRKV